MGSLQVDAVVDAAAAVRRAAGFLSSNPVELNVIWSVMRQSADSGGEGRYWLLEADGDVAGLVIESPAGHYAAISPVGRQYADKMASAILEEGHHLLGVVGEAGAAAGFAGCWSEGVNKAAVVEDAQRLYVLGDLTRTEGVAGMLRRAEHDERDLIIEWWSAFQVETGLPERDVSAAVDFGLSTGRLFFWDDGGPRCVARATQPLGGVSRIGAVFTPPRWRRRGYAAACVGALCHWVRIEEYANSILYAQLANPSSNAIYRRLGFRAVSELLTYRFDLAGRS